MLKKEVINWIKLNIKIKKKEIKLDFVLKKGKKEHKKREKY